MLGFGPISSRSISGSPFSLIAVTMAISATGAITFDGTADTKLYQNIAATGSITFGGAATWYCYYNQIATGGITFSGSALLRVIGRPFVFTAIPERLTFTGNADRYTFAARADNYTFRGMR